MSRAGASIRARLLVSLLGAVLAAGATAAVIVHAVALHEADEMFDYHIRQIALSLAAQSAQQGGAVIALADEEDHEELDFAVHIRDAGGENLYLSPNYPALPERATLGFSNVQDASGAWRIYATQWGTRTIQVVQPQGVRQEMAFASAIRTLMPLVFVIPILGLVIWLTVGGALRPLERVAGAVERRSAEALEPIDTDRLPLEVAPLVAALNRLLRRLEDSIAAQRAFIGDAAHELRTPLAALRLQAQVLARTQDQTERRQQGEEFVAAADRATHLVDQLLELARSEPGARSAAFAPVRLDELANDVAGQIVSAAVAKGVDLGVTAEEATVQGDAHALRILLRNLVDNAVRYTPPGGRVDVTTALENGHATLAVLDTGPGIPPADLERVFDRFHRVPGSTETGSGLGLAIAQSIAASHGARIRLEGGDSGNGLKASVVFPLERPVGGTAQDRLKQSAAS